MKIAQRNDWKTEIFPSTSKSIVVDRTYSKSEFEKIIVGTIPEEMEDKWFVFYEEPWLYLHRSWTGFCVFKVRFEMVDDKVQITEVWVNRNPEQYKETDDSRDRNLLEILLDYRAGYDTRSQSISYAKSLSE
ncbi:hypothetical protein [Chamaesiphon sp. VAR_48_metabat_135_sub]|uniref:hypothetical protein n=1 Tax=Chamaesiphon sp. VAR_48_metabat_135_sub TaxID=2964699 RepID=UPI002869EDEB|nr:hypothetical protein [Chamaesiphon sp. VAR_48_metabat_135_sub]